jgi:hypothetical protein
VDASHKYILVFCKSDPIVASVTSLSPRVNSSLPFSSQLTFAHTSPVGISECGLAAVLFCRAGAA